MRDLADKYMAYTLLGIVGIFMGAFIVVSLPITLPLAAIGWMLHKAGIGLDLD